MRIVRTDASWARLDERGAHVMNAAPWQGGRETGEVRKDPRLEVPVAPSKIVCVGRNYRAHAIELGHEVPTEPLLFLKPPSALAPSGGIIPHPRPSERVDFEGEIGVVIGQTARHVPEARAHEHIFGITCVNDVTARDLQRADVQFTRAKGFDGFCPVGPWIETEVPALDAIELITRVDGVVRQRARSDRMLWSIHELIAYISAVMTLEPGDLILTGTPEGVGPLRAGETVEVEIQGVGTLTSTMGERTLA